MAAWSAGSAPLQTRPRSAGRGGDGNPAGSSAAANWRRGYAFGSSLGLPCSRVDGAGQAKEVMAYTSTINTPSRQLMEKLGMTRSSGRRFRRTRRYRRATRSARMSSIESGNPALSDNCRYAKRINHCPADQVAHNSVSKAQGRQKGANAMQYKRISADCHLDLPWMPPDLFTSMAPRDAEGSHAVRRGDRRRPEVDGQERR